jgi:hypothetical protein
MDLEIVYLFIGGEGEFLKAILSAEMEKNE